MREYTITWKIELSGKSPQDAADTALDYIINCDARFFNVIDQKTKKETVIEARIRGR